MIKLNFSLRAGNLIKKTLNILGTFKSLLIGFFMSWKTIYVNSDSFTVLEGVFVGLQTSPFNHFFFFTIFSSLSLDLIPKVFIRVCLHTLLNPTSPFGTV